MAQPVLLPCGFLHQTELQKTNEHLVEKNRELEEKASNTSSYIHGLEEKESNMTDYIHRLEQKIHDLDTNLSQVILQITGTSV